MNNSKSIRTTIASCIIDARAPVLIGLIVVMMIGFLDAYALAIYEFIANAITFGKSSSWPPVMIGNVSQVLIYIFCCAHSKIDSAQKKERFLIATLIAVAITCWVICLFAASGANKLFGGDVEFEDFLQWFYLALYLPIFIFCGWALERKVNNDD